jgi:hypothetical protein
VTFDTLEALLKALVLAFEAFAWPVVLDTFVAAPLDEELAAVLFGHALALELFSMLLFDAFVRLPPLPRDALLEPLVLFEPGAVPFIADCFEADWFEADRFTGCTVVVAAADGADAGASVGGGRSSRFGTAGPSNSVTEDGITELAPSTHSAT